MTLRTRKGKKTAPQIGVSVPFAVALGVLVTVEALVASTKGS